MNIAKVERDMFLGISALKLSGIWLDDMRYQVSDTRSGKSEVVVIPTRDNLGEAVYDKSELEELEHFAKERVLAGWKDERPPTPLTRKEQKDLGASLMDIRSFHAKKRETGNGRVF